MKSGHVFPMGFPTLAAALQRWSQHLSGSWHSPPAFLFWFRCPPSPGPFRPWGGTEPALPNSFSFLSQGTALDVVAFLHPAHFFVNCPFIKFPSNYLHLDVLSGFLWDPDQHISYSALFYNLTSKSLENEHDEVEMSNKMKGFAIQRL